MSARPAMKPYLQFGCHQRRKRGREWCQRIRLTWQPGVLVSRPRRTSPSFDGFAGARGLHSDEDVAVRVPGHGHLERLSEQELEGDEEGSAFLLCGVRQ